MKLPHKKSSLSQVFLIDKSPCYKVLEELVANNVKRVLEIGPGGGALTEVLLEAGLSVVALEKDSRYCEVLTNKYQAHISSGLFTLINVDALEFDFSTFVLDSTYKGFLGVCGNIPYNISSPLVIKLSSCLDTVNIVSLLTQKEFAQRLSAAPSTKSYGSLSVFMQLRAKVSYVMEVKRHLFQPIPKVDSAIVSFFPLAKKFDEDLLRSSEKISKALFSKRRKKLRNSLKPFMQEKEELFSKNWDLNKRCEELSPEEFICLCREIKSLCSSN
jgi:16S rRNA (adenine1518-N6/adenine1519-N6)-dimethyltransferase